MSDIRDNIDNLVEQQNQKPTIAPVPGDIKHADIAEYVEDERVRALLARMPVVTNYGNIIFYSCRVTGKTQEEFEEAYERGCVAVVHHLTEAFDAGVFDERVRMHAPVIDMGAGKKDDEYAARILVAYVQLPDELKYREVLEVLTAFRHVTQTNDPAEV